MTSTAPVSAHQPERWHAAFVRWFVTICDHLLLTQAARPLPLTLALTLVPVCVLIALFPGHLFEAVSFPADQHARIDLDEALEARYCHRPAAWSTVRFADEVRANDHLMWTSFPDLIAAKSATVGDYCQVPYVEFLNNENSVGLLMRAALRVLPHPDAISVLYFLDSVRFFCVILAAFALLDAGASILLVCVVAWAITQLGVDVATFDFSIYAFLAPLLAAVISAYTILWRRMQAGRYLWLGGGSLVMGFVTAFGANMRSSYLPIFAVMFVVFLLAARTTRMRPKALTLVAACLLFVIGYVGFTRIFISPLVPKGSHKNFSYHAIFHPLVLGLAIPQNSLSRREGIVWNDMVGLVLAHRMIPDAEYLHPEYEKALFLYYVKLWLLYPSEMRDVYIQKFRLAGTGMALLRHEPMSQAVRPFIPESGLRLLAADFGLICAVAGFLLWRPRPLLFLLLEAAVVALLLQTESGLIMSSFYLFYDGYLLVFTFLLGPIAAQLVLDMAAQAAGYVGSSSGRSAVRTQDALERRTIADFGEQWTSYGDNSGYYGSAALFGDAFGRFLSTDMLKGKIVAEIGAGTGRFINIFLDAGAAQVVAVEPSDAASVLAQNIPSEAKARVEIVQARGEAIPGNDRFDYVFSIGVLHHIPDPDPVCRAAYRALRPGGTMAVWLYGREGNGVYLTVVEPLRWLTKRVPHTALAGLVWVIGWGLDAYIAAARVLPLPLRQYALGVLAKLSRDKRRLVIYDQLNPTYAKYYTKSEAEGLLTRAGFQDVRSHHRHGYSWTVIGEKPA